MLRMFEFFSFGFDIVTIAFALTVVTMIVLYCILLSIGKQYVRGIPFYLSGMMLFLMLFYQNILMTGAFYTKGLIVDFHGKAELMIQETQSSLNQVEDYQASIDKIMSEYTMLVPFVRTANENVGNMQEWLETTTDELYLSIRWFVVRRLVWSSVFVLLTMTITIFIGKNNADSYTLLRRKTKHSPISTHRDVARSSRRKSHRR